MVPGSRTEIRDRAGTMISTAEEGKDHGGPEGSRAVIGRANQVRLASRVLTSRFRLTPCSAACMARARCDSGGTRTMNLPL